MVIYPWLVTSRPNSYCFLIYGPRSSKFGTKVEHFETYESHAIVPLWRSNYRHFLICRLRPSIFGRRCNTFTRSVPYHCDFKLTLICKLKLKFPWFFCLWTWTVDIRYEDITLWREVSRTIWTRVDLDFWVEGQITGTSSFLDLDVDIRFDWSKKWLLTNRLTYIRLLLLGIMV